MFNFKYLGLPILVGLIGKTYADCSIPTFTDGACSITGCVASQFDKYYSYRGYIYKINASSSCTTQNINIGFYKHGDSYFECRQCDSGDDCHDNKKCTTAASPQSSCDNTSVGKLFKDQNNIKLCLGKIGSSTTYASLDFGKDDNEYYLVKHTKNENGNVFSYATNANYYVVKSNSAENGIILSDDNIQPNSGTFLDCAESSGKLITRIEDFCSADSSERYYTCKNGVCQSKEQLPGVGGFDDNGEDKCLSITESGDCSIGKASKCLEDEEFGSMTSDIYKFMTSDQKNIQSDALSGHYVKISKNDSGYSCTSLSGSVTSETYFENKAEESKSNYPLIHCVDNEGTNECKLEEAKQNHYYNDGETKVLMKYDGSTLEKTSLDKVETGLYINKDDKTVISCAKDSECIVGSAYLVNKCTESTIGNFRLNDEKEDEITLCGNYNSNTSQPVEFTELDKSYILSTTSGKFPGVSSSRKIHVQIKDNDKIIQMEDKDECTQDLEIVYDSGNYALCVTVTQTGTTEVDSGEKNTDGTPKMVTKNVYNSVKLPFEENGARVFGGIADGTTTTVMYCNGTECKPVNSNVDNKPKENDYYINDESRYGSSSGTVIKCLKQTIGEGQTAIEYVKCTVDNVIGYYTNSKKELISCENSKCEVITEKMKDGTTNYYLNGNFNNDNQKPIIECKPKSEENTPECTAISPEPTSETDDYNNYINANKVMSIIHCDIKKPTVEGETQVYSCNDIDAEKYGYYFTKSGNVAKYIQCENECTEDDKNGYYINKSKTGEIIKCNGGTCSSTLGYNYYVDTHYEGEKLIQCYGSTINPCIGGLTGLTRRVYISGNNSGENPNSELIACTDKCEVITGSSAGFQDKTYLNGGSDSKTNPLIKYSSYNVGENVLNSWVTSSATANTAYVNGNRNNDNTNNGVIFCTDTQTCTEVENTVSRTFINVNVTPNPKKITCDLNNDCLESDISLNSGQSVGYLINPSTGVVLKDNSANGKLVVCSKPADAIECQIKTSGYLSYYINGENTKKIIKNTNNVLSIEAEVTRKSYFVNSSDNIIACDGSTGCSIYTQVDCEANSIGSIKLQNLCVGYDSNTNRAITVSTSTNGKYIIDAKKFVGISSNIKMLISINNKAIFQSQPTATEYYLIDSSSSGIVKAADVKGDLYFCDNSKCDLMKKEGSFANSDIGTVGTYPTIKCEADATSSSGFSCFGVRKSTTDTYCLSTSKNLYICNSTNKCEDVNEADTTCVKQTVKTGYYLPYNNNVLLYCTAGNNNNCIEKTSIELEDTYYLSQDLSNPLIKCEASLDEKRCNYVSPGNGFYRNIRKNLIKCSGGICEEILNGSGYYLSAEPGKVLTYCDINSCTVDSKPAVGWYLNGSSDQNTLIKCTSQSSGVNCQEVRVQTNGSLLSAIDNSKLITCNDGVCNIDNSPAGYYVNAENNQLIYCSNSICSPFDIRGKGWYWVSSSELIGCTKTNICTKYNKEKLDKGYYLNSDPNTLSTKPLIEVSDFINKIESKNKGWYLNADFTEIISCSSDTTCIMKNILNTACSNQNKGEFTSFYGDIRWCNGQTPEVLPAGKPEHRIISYNRSGFIPGVNLPEGKREAYVRVEIKSNSVLQSIIDGYEYENGKLYMCYNNAVGNCINENIKNGYYFDHEELKITKCTNGACEVYSKIDDTYMKSCDESNVRIDKKKKQIQLCRDQDENNGNVSDFEKLNGISDIYALKSDLSNRFPGSTGRYILADVSKYSIIYKSNIEEIGQCPDESSPSDNKYCINNGKLYKKSDIATQITVSPIEISKNGLNERINYGYQTNDGYYIYGYDDSDVDNKINILMKVYIKINSEKKLICNIGGSCKSKNLDKVPIKYYEISADNILIKVFMNGVKEVVNSKILPGIYVMQNGQEAYECNNRGYCKRGGKTIQRDGVNMKVTVGGKSYTSSGEDSVFVFEENAINNRKRDSNNLSYGVVSELTHVSFAETDGSKNIFIDSNNFMVSNGDEEIKRGFSCINGKCREIKCKNDEYYINTIQTTSSETWKNAIVKCSLNADNTNKFETIHCSEKFGNQLFENAAAQSEDDILILCDSVSCQLQSASNINGLPLCKAKEGNSKVPDDSNKSCVRSDNSQALLEEQRCIMNNVIYKTSNGGCIRDEDSNEKGIVVFDSTLRMIKTENIAENHYRASVYNCKNDGKWEKKCYRVFGYIVNSSDYYSKCDSKGCVYLNYNENKIKLETNCEIAGSGNVIFDKNENEVMLCKDKSNTVKIKGASDKAYPIEINNINAFPEVISGVVILVGIHNNVAYVYSVDGYVLIDANDKIVTGNTGSGKLLFCDGKESICNVIENPDNGYYYSVFNSKTIKCVSNVCSIDNIASNSKYGIDEGSTKIKFTENEKEVYNYVKQGFPGFGYSVITKTNKYSCTVYYADNYVILVNGGLATNNESRELNDMYQCNGSIGKCSKVDVKDGYYVNGDSRYKAIKCANNECTIMAELNKQCSKEGDFIIKDNVYQFCLSSGAIKISENEGNSYKLVRDKAFPNGKDYVVVYSNAVIGIGSISKGSTFKALPTCKNSPASLNSYCADSSNTVLDENKYCVKENKIYKSVLDENVKKCIQQFAATTEVHIFNGDVMITEANIDTVKPTSGSQMYYCNKGICRVSTGYYKIKSNYYKCNYSGCESISTYGNEIGSMISAGTIKLSNGNGSMSEGSYYYIENSNDFPGAQSYKNILIESGKDYFVIFRGNGYYLINSSNSMLYEDTEPVEGSTKKREIGETSEENINEEDEIDEKIKEKRASTNALYYCDNSSGNCKLQTGVSGYYINAYHLPSYNKALIMCYEGTCNLANDPEIKFGIGACDKAATGVIIRQKSTYNYKFCYGRTSNNNVEMKDKTPLKYYIITLTKGDIFTGINMSDDSTPVNASVKLLVKTYNTHIEQFKTEGYILFNNNEILVNEEDRGQLYYCKNDVLYEGSGIKTVQCNEVTGVKDGWYFNNNLFKENHLYYKCVDGNCSISKALEKKECPESGSLLYNNEGFKLCITKEKQIDISTVYEQKIIVNVSNMNEFPGLTANDSNIVVKLDKESVRNMKTNSYVVTYNNSTLISKVDVSGTLYKCISGICEKNIIPNDGWYIKSNDNDIPNELIKCSNKLCHIRTEIAEGFYESANISKPIIQCVLPGKEIDGSFVQDENSSILCYEKDYIEGWYMNADVSTSNEYPLINCSKELGCNISIANSNGWYSNNAYNNIYSYATVSNATVYPYIQCVTSTSCEIYKEEFNSKCEKGGQVIVNNKNYKICKDGSNSIDFSASNGSYQVLSVTSGTDFPGASTGFIVVKISKTEAVQLVSDEDKYYYKDSTVYKCSSTVCEKVITEGITILEELTRSLMTSGSCTEENCNWAVNNKEGNFFTDSSNKLVISLEQIPNSLFRCKKNDINKLICYDMKEGHDSYPEGYYYNNEIKNNKKVNVNTLYKYDGSEWKSLDTNINNVSYEDIGRCTLYKSNVCYININNEQAGTSENPTINPGTLCVNENGKYYLAIAEINTGIDNVNCVNIPTDASINYYPVTNYGVFAVDKYSAYDKREDVLINSLNSYTFRWNEDFNGIMKSDHSIVNDNTITCNDKQCKSEKSLSCTYDFQTSICKLTSGSARPGQLCTSSLGHVYLINSNQGNCYKYEIGWSIEKEESSIYDNNELYHVIDGKMYKTIDEKTVEITGDGVYILNNVDLRMEIEDYEKIDISGNDIYKLYVCNEKGCELRNSCKNGDLYEYMYDNSKNDNSPTVYKCDPANNTLEKVRKVGYFLNYAWSNLIECFTDSQNEIKCEIRNKDNGMEGYYLDIGNDEMMVKCKRDEGEFNCINEPIVECEYDDKDEKCSSEVDLLRNSYCYYSVEDKISGLVKKMVYVENYIRAGDVGNCIANDGNEYYYKYKKSKFLGHEEREDLIKFTQNKIVSIYEKDVGYYIISTNTGKGIDVDTALNKSRMYKCEKQNCEEIREPHHGNVYVNKASTERIVEYNKDEGWIIKRNRCDVKFINTSQCKLSSTINAGDIIYLVNGDDVTFYYATNAVTDGKDPTTSNPQYPESKNKEIRRNYYQYIRNDEALYLFNKNGQVFEVVDDEGYYIFKNSEMYDMIGYISTVNVTTTEDNYYVYQNVGGLRTIKTIDNRVLDDEGYYWNKADNNGLGIYIQHMLIPEKKVEVTNSENSNRKRDSEVITNKFKAVRNRCVSNRKNICVNTDEDHPIQKGSGCVVLEGEYRGLYLATSVITSISNIINCVKYDEEVIYHYLKDKHEFAGEDHVKTIIRVMENEIKPFKNDISDPMDDTKYDGGFYILDGDKKLLKSTEPSTGSGYECKRIVEYDENGEEKPGTDKYECGSISNPNKYYYEKESGEILNYAGNKWSVDSNLGYFFYNKNYREATVTKNTSDGSETAEEVLGAVNVKYTGKYINSMVTDKVVIVGYESEEERSTIETDINKCTVASDNVCTPVGTTPLEKGSICYDAISKSLNVVDVVEIDGDDDKKKTLTYCYSGTENSVKYYQINNILYRLDGKSVQNMRNGYYVLNEKWEEFSSNYPETPYKLIYCDEYNCNIPTDGLKTDVDVIINNAGTGSNRLLKRYKSVNKLMNAVKPGFYFMNGEGDIEINEEYVNYENRFVILDNGNLAINLRYKQKEKGYYAYDINEKKDVQIDFNPMNVYINYAKEGSFIRSYVDFVNSDLTYDSKKDVIKYDNTLNMDEDKNVFKYVGDEIFLLKPKMLVALEKGIYAIKNDLPFKEKQWSSLSVDREICYYTGAKCSSVMLNSYKKQRYMINNASEDISIIEYNSDNDEWRYITDDGFYFFFEDMHSINKADRRISKVIEIVNGNAVDVTSDLKRNGHYLFEDMMIESNKEGWEDGESILRNVELEGKRQCKSYEPGELIENMEFCYNDESGICIVKEDIISDESKNNNCIFNNNKKLDYYLINDGLYIINEQAYQRIDKSGIYVIDMNSNIFSSKTEDLANAYECENEKCALNEDMKSEYYMNMANVNEDVPIIIYYDGKTGNWRKTTQNGFYFFNKKGYPVSDGEEVMYAYSVSENGNVIKNIKNESEKGKFISEAIPDQNILVRNDGEWSKAENIPECIIDTTNNKVVSKVKFNPGDICLDNKRIVVIKGRLNKTKRDETEDNADNLEEVEYEGILSVDGSITYYYNESSKSIEKIEETSVSVVSGNGMIILDSQKSLPLDSVDPIDGISYSCVDGICNVSTETELILNKLYINVISEVYPLVKYVGDGKWSVMNEAGYYFLNEKGEPVGQDDIVGDAVKVEILSGRVIQENIKNFSNVGFYFNKANEEPIVVSYNSEFWVKGELAHNCNITEVVDGEGMNCKTMSEGMTYSTGSYCYQLEEGMLYLLTNDATFTVESNNCVSMVEEEKRYISSDRVGSTLNGVTVSSKLIELSENAIQVAGPGYYVLNKNGYLVTDNTNTGEEGGTIEVVIYECNSEGCVSGNIAQDMKFLLNNGVYEYDAQSKIVPIVSEGLYFFNEEGKACTSEEDEVKNIIRITKSNNDVVVENMNMNGLKEGAYVNEADVENVGVYNGNEWSIVTKNCEYKEETGSCVNDRIELNVGSYCVVEGVMHIIYEINEEEDIKKCVPGNNEKPVYFHNINNDLVVVTEKNVSHVKEAGYYAIQSGTYQSLISEKPVNSTFIQCEYGGECTEYQPDNGRYLNKSPISYNIVEYPNGDLEKAITIEKNCKVVKNKCKNKNNLLNVGDVCIATDSLYLVGENNKCMKAEKSIISFQIVGGKLYMLTNDSVVQKVDGYFFINREKRAISKKEDYKKAGTKGYICSKSGDCYLLEPDEVTYYKDYNSINENKFNVVKFVPEEMRVKKREEVVENENNEIPIEEEKDTTNEENKNEQNAETENKNQNEENNDVNEDDEEDYEDEEDVEEEEEEIDESQPSGFENISEEGIIKLADGSYVKCELDNNNEVSCSNIEETGSMVTIDNELITCVKNEEEVVECSQAVEEGYYVLNGELLECSPNEEHDKLECKEMKKEGYFMAAGGDGLYECVEKTEENEGETKEEEEPVSEENVNEEINDNVEEDVIGDENANAAAVGDEAVEGEPAEGEQPVEEKGETEQGDKPEEEQGEPVEGEQPVEEPKVEEPVPEVPVEKDVECGVIECIEGKPITVKDEEGKEIEIYICKDEKWIEGEKECNSYIKEGEFYKCDNEEKDKLDEDKIDKPNTDHTTDGTATKTKTTKRTTTTTSATTTTTTTTTTASDTKVEETTKKESSTTKSKTTSKESSEPTTATTTTTKKTSTTSTKPSATNTKESGAFSIHRNINFNIFYLALSIFLYFLFI
ncbi:scaffoldin [Neocallimastix sp. 'constans']